MYGQNSTDPPRLGSLEGFFMRPEKVVIDEKQITQLSALQCSVEEIAKFFGTSRNTIYVKYRKALDKGREEGKVSLRRHQFKLSEKSAAMAIWLGKQYLGQSEKLEYVNEDMVKSEIVIVNNLPKNSTLKDNNTVNRFSKYIQK